MVGITGFSSPMRMAYGARSKLLTLCSCTFAYRVRQDPISEYCDTPLVSFPNSGHNRITVFKLPIGICRCDITSLTHSTRPAHVDRDLAFLPASPAVASIIAPAVALSAEVRTDAPSLSMSCTGEELLVSLVFSCRAEED